MDQTSIFIYCFIGFGALALAIYGFTQQPRLQRERDEKDAEIKKKQDEEDSIIKNIANCYQDKIEPNIKSKDSVVTIVQNPEEDRFKSISYYLWKESSRLFFCPINNNDIFLEFITNPNKLEIISLDISDIEYYTIQITEKSEIRSSGGEISGGGSSLAGAVVGGVVAGGVGAVIGSRKEIKGTPLKIETVNVQNTVLFLKYYGIDSIKHILYFMPENLNILRHICPEKDINFKGNTSHSINNTDIVTKMSKLKEMHDLNIITEDEFNTKKQELLSQL